MIWEGFKPECDKPHQMNTSSLLTLLTLSVATSIDALSVGFTFVSFGVRTLAQAVWPLVLIGVVSLAMSLLGVLMRSGAAGDKVRAKFNQGMMAPYKKLLARTRSGK